MEKRQRLVLDILLGATILSAGFIAGRNTTTNVQYQMPANEINKEKLPVKQVYIWGADPNQMKLVGEFSNAQIYMTNGILCFGPNVDPFRAKVYAKGTTCVSNYIIRDKE